MAPAIASPAAVFMTEKFKKIHSAAYVAFLKATKAKDSKWKLVTAADKSACRVHKLQDMWAFARSARELPHIAGVLPSYQKPPRNVKLPQGRIRRPLEAPTRHLSNSHIMSVITVEAPAASQGPHTLPKMTTPTSLVYTHIMSVLTVEAPAASQGPVSYTHLTLPTILLV